MAKLKISNSSNGRVFETLTGVLAHVALAGVTTTTGVGGHIITVTSTTGIYPGMSIRAPGVPPGSVVNAVLSTTQLELYRTAWDAATGVYSHSAINARATDVYTSKTGHALAFDPQALVYQTYIEGTWRNTHRIGSSLSYSISNPNLSINVLPPVGGVALVPTTITLASGLATTTAASVATTDELASTPVKRHDGEPHVCLLVVHTGGMLSVIHQPHEKNLTYAGE